MGGFKPSKHYKYCPFASNGVANDTDEITVNRNDKNFFIVLVLFVQYKHRQHNEKIQNFININLR